jgi:hypothetical protein
MIQDLWASTLSVIFFPKYIVCKLGVLEITSSNPSRTGSKSDLQKWKQIKDVIKLTHKKSDVKRKDAIKSVRKEPKPP